MATAQEPSEPARRPGFLAAEPSVEGEVETALAKALQRLLVPPRAAVPTEEDVEKIVERMLRKFFGNLAQVKAE